ncbi:MAG: argininosuccinate lyase [Bacteroidaceae bacterium]|nr:argininosuccinate lyase [Bacteroidaceae bacterium]
MKPIWDKGGKEMNSLIGKYTVGRDREMDMLLARYDVLGSMAHITMLQKVGLLKEEELKTLLKGLNKILQSIDNGEFTISPNVEDVHSEVESELTQMYGEMGKKIHSGRSRNDQVLVDLKLFTRSKLREMVVAMEQLFDVLIGQSNKYKDVYLPGYTHLQIAMPSSFGLWFGAYAESLADDMIFVKAAFDMCNQNPLGSAAGYGSSFPLDRDLTTKLLGFDSMNYNVVYAQMTRGKLEKNVAFAIGTVAATLSRLAFDACLFNSQNFGFIKLPEDCTTGSSIMPHKKNPDVFELTRAKCNSLQALQQNITLITNNLPSGYFRDMQQIKELFLPAFDQILDILTMVTYMVKNISPMDNILEDSKYDPIFSVEEVNRLVLEGVPFREAYVKVGQDIANGKFKANKKISHTHQGSIGNLCNDRIKQKMDAIISSFPFEKIDSAIQSLIDSGK